jgi:ribose transport system permease protein
MKRFALTQERIVLATLVAALLLLSVFLHGFATRENFFSLLQTVAVLGILGLGMAIVIIGRGIDLSMIASLVIPVAFVLQQVQDGASISHALGSATLLTLVFGLVNGWLIAYAEVPALFVTLASGLFLSGLGPVKLFMLEVVQWPDAMAPLVWLGQGRFLGIPNPILVFLATALLVELFLRWFRAGRFIYALGDNPFAARTSGMPVRPLIVLQYTLAALIGLFAGLMMAASTGSTSTRLYNSTMIYDVILVAVLGGIGLSGGRGGVLNVILGTLLIGTMVNAMTIMNLTFAAQNLVKGLVLLATIIIDSILNPRNEETAQQGDI